MFFFLLNNKLQCMGENIIGNKKATDRRKCTNPNMSPQMCVDPTHLHLPGETHVHRTEDVSGYVQLCLCL